MRKETPWGTWDHVPLEVIVEVFARLEVPWWIAGGYAIDAFAGSGRRDHDDIDVSLFARDRFALQEHLADWELHYGGDGTLKPWAAGMELPVFAHDIWARRDPDDAWRFQLMLNPGGPDFTYRRDERIRLPFEEATYLRDGVRYLAPEVQLLFKCRSPRPKDEQDLADCLPLLETRQRTWLAEAMALAEPASPWLALVRAGC